MKKRNSATKFFVLCLILIPLITCGGFGATALNDADNPMGSILETITGCLIVLCIASLFVGIVVYIRNLVVESKKIKEEKRQQNMQIMNAINSILPNGMVYKIEGVRGRQLEVYKDRCVLKVTVTAGSLMTGNYSDGEKTIYYADCIGVQFKESGLQIGYLQLETATGLMNNRSDNFFNENSFTFDESVVTNAKMREVADYIRERVAEEKGKNNSSVVAQVSSADELKKFKELLDSGIITQEEFDAKKKQLLGL